MATSEYIERCVVIEGQVSDVTDDKFRSYFENGIKSGGGDIREMKRSSKGLIIEFMEKKDALGVINKRNHRIGGSDFLATQFQPPDFYKDTICVMNLPDSFDQDNLLNFLEGRAQVAVNEISYNEDTATAIISFSEEIDFSRTKDKIANREFSRRKLEIKQVEVSKVIQVTGFSKEITDENLKLYFENKRRSGGGKVSEIERIEDTIFVHFDDSDAPNRVKGKKHRIGDEDLQVTIYHECLSVESEQENPTESYLPDPVIITEMLDQKKIQMLREHPGLLEALNTNLDASKAKISNDNTGSMTIECTVIKCTKKTKKQLQSWQTDVKSSIQKFFEDNIYQEAVPTEKEFKVNVKEWMEKNYNDKQYLYCFQDEDKLIIEGMKDIAKILADGVKQYINDQRKIIENEKKVIMESMCLKEEQVFYLKHSGLLNTITEMFPDNGFNIIENTVEINGTAKHIKLSKEEIEKSISELKKHKPNSLTPNQQKIIVEPSNIRESYAALRNKGLRCALLYQKGLNILHKADADPSSIEKTLRDFVPEKEVKIPPENHIFIASSTFKNGFEKILNSFSMKAAYSLDEDSYSITVTALENVVDQVTDKLQDYVNNPGFTKKSIEFENEFRKKYFYEKGEDLINEMENKFCVRCQWQVEGEYLELIVSALEADQKKITDAQSYIDEISKGQIEKTLYYKGPGVANLLNEENLKKIQHNTVFEFSGLDPNDTEKIEVDKTFKINGTDVEVKIGHGTPAFLHSDMVLVPITKTKKSLNRQISVRFSLELANSLKDKVEGETLDAKDTSDFYSKNVVYGIYPTEGDNAKKTMINNIIESCLVTAEREKYSSIAIPIVKTKDALLNKTICQTTYEVVQDHFTKQKPDSYIQTVWFYGEERNREFISNAVQANEKNSTIVKKRYRAKGDSNSTVDTGHVRMLLVTSDIIHEETHVLVNSTNEDLDLNQGHIAKAFLQKCGEQLQKECKEKYPNGIKQGEVAFTNSYNIVNTKRIYHVCLPPYQKDKELNTLVSSVKTCLTQAAKEKKQSIAFPPIGCGVLKYPREEVAKKLFETVYQFGKNNANTSLSDVTFVMYHKDEKVIKAFEAQEKIYKEQYKIVNRNTSLPENTDDSTEELLPLGIYRKCSAVLITVYALKDEDVKNFEKACLKRISDNIKTREERSSELTDYDEDQLNELMEEIREKGLQIEVIVDRNKGICDMRGCQDELTEICQLVKQYCTKMKEMNKNAVNLQKQHQWYYTEITETEERLLPYDVINNYKIDKAYNENKESVIIKDDEGIEFIIDFLNMTEHDVRNDVQEESDVTVVRKCPIQELAGHPPTEWGNMGSMNLDVEKLQPASTKYKQIKQKFEESLGAGCRANIEKIELIKNVTLYKQYQAMKKKIEKENGGNAHEKQLFHGTNYEATKKINKEGFNRSYCDQAKSALGMGVYFATQSAYSARDDYAKKDQDGCKYMYLADVLVGKPVKGQQYVVGTKDLVRKLPIRDETNCIYYNSAVDKVEDPRTYAIFNDNQAYPTYLICFKDT